MKIGWAKDGGPDSNVWGLYLPELKNWFSVVLLRFEGKSRDSYHNHAFDSIAWVLWGELVEETLYGNIKTYKPSLFPLRVPRSRFHRVSTTGPAWVLNFRGPWLKTWWEWSERFGYRQLSHGRQEIP